VKPLNIKFPVYLFLIFFCHTAVSGPGWLELVCADCSSKMEEQTGVFILDRGVDSLLTRAWLTRQATQSIDIQYFIWSTDNIGILASTELLAAAKQGVKVRVLVDDLLIDAQDTTLLALNAHPNVEIRIYNPQHSVGISLWQRARNLLTNFRRSNQRMHDKTAIFDGIAGVTGGRNMADEYFDFDHHYNFRDRDVLLFGRAVSAMSENFEEFWRSELAVPVNRLLPTAEQELTQEQVDSHFLMLQEYASNPDNFAPEVRETLEHLSSSFSELAQQLIWDEVSFISDAPGKNANEFELDGSGEATDKLIELLQTAKESVLIQSPYLIMPDGGVAMMAALVKKGVEVKISTNSLASTDNLMAFSGYYKQRDDLLAAGVEIFEFRPDAAIRSQLIQREERMDTTFAIHAKSLLIDKQRLYIGTFNLDPRSANLNTEVGILVDNALLGEQLGNSIGADMLPENSWAISPEFNPDDQVGWLKRLKLWFYSLLPMNAIL
jgi:putative cardiolipin synthase